MIDEAGRYGRAHDRYIADRAAFKRSGQPENVARAFSTCRPASQYTTSTVATIAQCQDRWHK
jgi:hypothetical protein